MEYGGLGLGVFEYVLVTEELARGWMSVASIIARGNGLFGGFVDEQRRSYDDPSFSTEPLGGYPAMWNPREWLNSNRSP
jgi:alkylation response protein AidB-like acyl-CoA dehydrogenase